VATPYDELFRFLCRYLRHAEAWLRSCLAAVVRDTIDWSSLRPGSEALQDETLRVRFADRVWVAQHRDTGEVAWLFGEHKAYGDPDVAEQITRYAVLLRDLPPRDGDVPPIAVLPVLLHHGDAPFVHPPSNEWLAEFQPRAPFAIDDLTAQDEATILRRELTPLGTLCFLCLRFLRDAEGDVVLATLDRWADLLRAVDRDPGPPSGETAIQAVAGYVLRTSAVEAGDLHMTIERILQRREWTIMSTAEKLVNQGIEKGRTEGRTEGLAEGITKGRVDTLRRLLTKRFGELPPSLPTRLLAASPDDLDRWTDRVLDAPSLDAVFAP